MEEAGFAQASLTAASGILSQIWGFNDMTEFLVV